MSSPLDSETSLPPPGETFCLSPRRAERERERVIERGGGGESGPRSPETESNIFQAPTLACLACCGCGVSVSVTPHTSTSFKFGFFIGTQYLSYFGKLNIVHNGRSRISNNP